jgi:hypothetical protein
VVLLFISVVSTLTVIASFGVEKRYRKR